MKSATCFLFSIALVVVLVPFLSAQQGTASSAAATTRAAAHSDAPDKCGYVFTAGSGNNSIVYCVTDTANILISTPINHPMISVGGEGYGLCQESPAVEYHDYLFSSSGNWNAPQVVSVSKSTVKISRTTSDGNWTLVQTISKVAATASIKVVMALTNNQSVDKVAYLLRFAGVDANGLPADSTHRLAGASLQSAWSWDATDNTLHYGLQLLNSGKSAFGYQQGFARLLDTGPNACDFAGDSSPDGLAGADALHGVSIAYTYAGVVPAHQTLTVTMIYRAT